MKIRALVAVAAATVLAVSAFAADYGSGGCGLGSLVFKNNTMVEQILAATTNGTSGNQTFGITTGTLGCDSEGSLGAGDAQRHYIAANYRTLSREMAVGEGEHVASLASLLGCTQQIVPEFLQLTRTNYETIFVTENVTPKQLLSNLKVEMTGHPTLSSCKYL